MVVLGLGTNLGNRRKNLANAIELLAKGVLTHIQSSPVYENNALLPADAPPSWDIPFLNMAVSGRTSLKPKELLRAIKVIEKKLGRDDTRKWSPRPIDIDILAWDALTLTTKELTIPHTELLKRSFALLPLTDLAPHWQYPLTGKHQHKTAEALCTLLNYKKDFSKISVLKPHIVGILNVTPDSFSDGGNYLNPQKALAQYKLLTQKGATIIDIGAESTRPKATLLTPDQEYARLYPVLENIPQQRKATNSDTLLSLDTRHAQTVKKLLPLGIDWVNDVSGLHDPAMCRLIADHNLKAVLMHSLSVPANPSITLPSTTNVTDAVLVWAEKRIKTLIGLGIPSSNIIFDPGIGFGKTAYQSLALIKNIYVFKTLGCKIMLGHSRKSFMKVFTDKPFASRDFETAIISSYIGKYVDYLRVHDVEKTMEGLIINYYLGE